MATWGSSQVWMLVRLQAPVVGAAHPSCRASSVSSRSRCCSRRMRSRSHSPLAALPPSPSSGASRLAALRLPAAPADSAPAASPPSAAPGDSPRANLSPPGAAWRAVSARPYSISAACAAASGAWRARHAPTAHRRSVTASRHSRSAAGPASARAHRALQRRQHASVVHQCEDS